jgi:hypothetical protein
LELLNAAGGFYILLWWQESEGVQGIGNEYERKEGRR